MRGMGMTNRGAIRRWLGRAAAAGKALAYADPARFLVQLVCIIGNFGFAFLALHLMTKTVTSIVPLGAEKILTAIRPRDSGAWTGPWFRQPRFQRPGLRKRLLYKGSVVHCVRPPLHG